MDDVVKRLKETSDNCIKSYETWSSKSSDISVREDLQSHIHELRKVASRLEIEIAMSERDQMKSKRIPIPPHRSSTPHNNNSSNNKNNNNKQSSNEASPPTEKNVGAESVKKVMRRTRKPKEPSAQEEQK